MNAYLRPIGPWLARKAPWLLVGLALGILLTPLVLTGARTFRAIKDVQASTTTWFALATAVDEHPFVATAALLVALTAFSLVFSAEHGERDIKLAWGLFETKIPDPVREAEAAIRRSRRVEAKAAEILEDVAAVVFMIQDAALRPSPERNQRLIDEICELASRALSVGHTLHSSLWRPDTALGGDLRITASYRVPPQTAETFRLHPGEGFAGGVYSARQARVIPNTSSATDNEYKPDPGRGRAAMTIMGLPVYSVTGGMPTAVLCFSQSVERGAPSFGPEDLVRAQPYVLLMGLALTATETGQRHP